MSNDEIKKENNFKKKWCEPVLTFQTYDMGH
jgi:hypothetical protein